MIKVENVDVYGWSAAVRGMRNPMNSWDKSDSNFSCENCTGCYWIDVLNSDGDDTWCNHSNCRVGENDLKLMQTLSKAGSDHAKFLRYIDVTVDITAPLYFWKEFDTYRVGVVPNPIDIEMNSCSTMHKIHEKEFTIDDFSHEHIENTNMLWMIPDELNTWRTLYLKTKDKRYWWQMIQLLPNSYNQKRTIKLNYQVLKNMYHSRKNHKLDEWREFCKWCETLPYFKEICIDV